MSTAGSSQHQASHPPPKYEAPPRPPAAVQSGRPPSTSYYRTRSFVSAEDIAKPTDQRPILSPITEQLTRCALQPWQQTHSATILSWRRLVIELLEKSAGVDGLAAEGIPVLTMEVNPLLHGSKLKRSALHRATPVSYRTAWSVAYLHLLNHVAHHNIMRPADGPFLGPVPRLRSFFSAVDKEAVKDVPDAELKSSAQTLFPEAPFCEWTTFNPRRAVVFGFNEDRTELECLAGWARWSALVLTLEGIKARGNSLSNTYQAALEMCVPIYIIDLCTLTEAQLTSLSTGMNLMDSDNSNPLESFHTNPILNDIRSRPYSLYDRIWTLHHMLLRALEESDKDDQSTLVSILYNEIQNDLYWHEFAAWLETEGWNLDQSAWLKNPLLSPDQTDPDVNRRDPASRLKYAVETILAFLISLAWPIPMSKVRIMTLAEVVSTLGESDFPFGALRLNGKVRSGVFFWDDLFQQSVPFQIQCVYSMSDLIGFVAIFEAFFTPRSRRQNSVIGKLEWASPDVVSLVNHFAKMETASAFVARIVSNDALKSMSLHANPEQFESLSAFICLYNLHYELELEECDLRKSDDPQTIQTDIPGLLGVAASRVLHVIRAIAVYAYLTCDNPLHIQEITRLQQAGASSAPLTLVIPHPNRPNYGPLSVIAFQTPSPLSESRRQIEEMFEVLLGMLAELIFREFINGLGRDEVYGPHKSNRSKQSEMGARLDLIKSSDPAIKPESVKSELVKSELPKTIERFTPPSDEGPDLNSNDLHDSASDLRTADIRPDHQREVSGAEFRRDSRDSSRRDSHGESQVPASLRESQVPASLREAQVPPSLREAQVPASLREAQVPASLREAQVPASLRESHGSGLREGPPPPHGAFFESLGGKLTGRAVTAEDDHSGVSSRSQELSYIMELRVRRQDSGFKALPTCLSETLRAGGLLIQYFVRSCMGPSKARISALFPSNSEETSQGFNRVYMPDLMGARQQVYDHCTKQLVAHKLDCSSFSHFLIVSKVLEPLQNRAADSPHEAAKLATNILCDDHSWRHLVFQPPNTQIRAQIPHPPLMTLSAPTIDPPASTDPSQMPEILKSRGMKEAEYYGRVCRQRFIALAAAQSSAATHSRNDPTRALTTLDLKKLLATTKSDYSAGDNHRRISKWFEERKQESRELLGRISKFVFEPPPASDGSPPVLIRLDFRKMSADDAKEHAGPLGDLAQDSIHIASSLVEMPYQLEVTDPAALPFAATALANLRNEVESMLCAHLSDGLTQLVSSAPDTAHSVVASARPAIICAMWQTLVHLSPFLDVLHPLALRWNNLRAKFCAWLWRELRLKLDAHWTNICEAQFGKDAPTPFLRWSMRCLPGDQDTNQLTHIPDLTSERLLFLLEGPRMQDRICSAFYRFQCSSMANARAALGTAAVGEGATAEALSKIFSTSEISLKDLFRNVWSKVQSDTSIEDALQDPEVAAAGFLKRYAPYVLSGLDEVDRQSEVTGLGFEAGDGNGEVEPGAKRRRREQFADDDDASGTNFAAVNDVPRRQQSQSRTRQLDGTVAGSLLLGSLTVQQLKKELRPGSVSLRAMPGKRNALSSGGKRLLMDVEEGETSQTDEVLSDEQIASLDSSPPSAAHWLTTLPMTLKYRLARPVPSDNIFESFERKMEEQLEKLHQRPLPSARTTTSSSAPPSRKRRRRGGDTQSAQPPGEEHSSDNGGPDHLDNGAFPSMPSWIAHEPAWNLWRPPIKKMDTLLSPWTFSKSDEDVIGDYGLAYIPLSSHYISTQSDVASDLSERDWSLIKCVLEYFHSRGIDGLFSSKTQSVFQIDVRSAGGGGCHQTEWRRELDESAEASHTVTTGAAHHNVELIRGHSLRRYLSGWSVNERLFDLEEGSRAARRLGRRVLLRKNGEEDCRRSDENLQDLDSLIQNIVV